ncbi:MAG: hypothetical protein WAM07_06510 [Halobacillus sp.]|uniref:hypothetical protein n=1 Tax=Halobacillus sp. TaxID=56800 RepID=UPI003BAE1E39
MEQYTVDQALEKLKQYKITTHKESLRRWLRNGTIKGVEPATRKDGWRINKDDLWSFIEERTLINEMQESNTTNVAKEDDVREFYRAEMWWEIARKNMFEGSVEVKKTDVRSCIKQKNYSEKFEIYIWNRITEHTWQATPRIFYLHDAFLFSSQRIKMDTNYKERKEQILFALIEYLRNNGIK